MRLRFALAAAIPALLALGAMGLLADRLARGALEDELGARLVAVAQSAAAAVPADRVITLQQGEETTRTYANIRARLEAVARATSTRIFVAKTDRTALADSSTELAIGQSMPRLERDQLELSEVIRGIPRASAVLFRGSDEKLYKTGYAPVLNASGNVVALVGAEGTASSFAALAAFRRLLITLALLGAVGGALAAGAAALTVTRPLAALVASAQRIGGGDLTTPLGDGGGGPEIATLRVTLEEMRRSLAARDEEREMMLAGIAHEIRNPLGGIELFAGLLDEALRGRPESEHLARIRTEMKNLARIVEDFLEYARHRTLQLALFDARQLLAEVSGLALPLAEAKQVTLTVNAAQNVPANGDRELLRRALLNLVRNAVEATPAGSSVALEATRSDGVTQIAVLDSGAGIGHVPPEKLFRPFFTTKEKGTGLGLALAKKIADAHGATLSLEQRLGGGTAARLRFSLTPDAQLP